MQPDELAYTQATDTLEAYSEPLRRSVCAALIKPRHTMPLEELVPKAIAVLQNPPVVDRRLKELTVPCRKILAVMALTRVYRWKLGHLLAALHCAGERSGLEPFRQLLEAGFLYPELAPEQVLDSFEQWTTQPEYLQRTVMAVPSVSQRANIEPLELAEIGAANAGGVGRIADGLEWIARTHIAIQLVMEGPMRRTQSGSMFKRDLTRLKQHEILNAAPDDQRVPCADAGSLALQWALAAGWLQSDGDEVLLKQAVPPPEAHNDCIQLMVAALHGVEAWDPLQGSERGEAALPILPSVLAGVLLAFHAAGDRWFTAADVGGFLWEHHPSWASTLAKDVQKLRGASWCEALLQGVYYQLGLLELYDGEPTQYRLTALGHWLVHQGKRPDEPPSFPQSVLVQPNAEILAYRQGLTPRLIHKLSRMATWKRLGAACTLELNAEQTYRGLESGLTLGSMVQTLNQHGTKPVPAAVSELLQRWANKRERLTVFPSATLVEFSTAADLNEAITRGLVALRVTDRIGLCSDGGDPDFKQLRLIGNREYDLRPTRCVAVADDGLTLTVDAGQSDLLLEAEIGRVAVPDAGTGTNYNRTYTVTPQSIAGVLFSGWKLDQLEQWFLARTGVPMPPVCRMFATATAVPESLLSNKLVLQVPNITMADGLMQWTTTRPLLEERLGPTCLTLDEQKWPALQAILVELGLRFDVLIPPT